MEFILEKVRLINMRGLCNVIDGEHTFGSHRWNKWAFESSAL